MNIIIVDGYTLNPGDLSWEAIRRFGNVTYYDRTSEPEIPDRCRDADIILTNKVPIRENVIHQCQSLKLICVTATGYNIVDVEAARDKNVTVCNVPSYGTASVAQHTFALLLELSNHVGINSASVRQGDWQASRDFCYTKGSLMELQGKTLGIVGLGKIGEQVARVAGAFDMRVIYHSRTPKQTGLGKYCALEELFETSDIISLHCPLTPDNQQFINRQLLMHCKPTAWLINTSRGQLINEGELAAALNDGILAAAVLDVLAVEPPVNGNPLIGAKNCFITPHTAWVSWEARERILKTTEQNIASFLNGKPQHVV